MSDPFDADSDGRLLSGIYRAFPHYDIEEAVANGWRRLQANCSHPLEQHGDWLKWGGEGKPWLPT